MTLEKIENDLVKAGENYNRTEQDMKSVRKRLHRRSNKVLILESKRRQLLRGGQ